MSQIESLSRVLVPTPTADGDATTKKYVDDAIAAGSSPLPYAVYTRTSTVSISSGSHSLITWQSIDHSTGTWTSTNTSTVSIPSTGLYRASLAAHLTGSTTGWVQMTMTLNSSSVTGDAPFLVGGHNQDSGAAGLVQGTSRPLEFDSADVIRVFIFQSSGGSLDLSVRGDVPILALERIR